VGVNRLRVGVIGVGHLGRHHARILASTAGVELAAVADIDAARAESVAGQYGVRAYGDNAALFGRVDAVTVAVPTASHVEVALPFLERGIPVLVEKPMAGTLADADTLIEAAARRGTLLAVGHTERFNPAVTAAAALISNPRFVEVHRLGVFPERSLDIDVVFDLMIHDLDLLLALVGSDVVAVEAVGVPVLTDRIDIANARLRFASGCIANVTASRISRDRVRKIRFFQHDAYVSIDYAAREADVYRLVPQEGRPLIQGGRIDVVDGEPLRIELEDFVDAVRTGRQPRVTAQAGRAALALATAVTEQMEQGT
jgi:predicted dehydrogenase